MFALRRKILLNLIRVADLVVMIVAFAIGMLISGQIVQGGGLSEYFAVRIKLVNFFFFVGWLVTWYLLLKSFGLYRSRRSGVMASEWWAISKAVAIGTLLLSFAAVLFDMSAVTPVFLITYLCVVWLGTVLGRFVLRSFFTDDRSNRGALQKLVIVGCGPRGAEFGKKVRQRPDFGYLLLGYVDEMAPPENPLHGGPEKILGTPEELRQIIETHDVDEVVITLPIASHYQTISNIILVCEELSVDVFMPSDFFKSRLVSAAIDDSRAWPAMELRRPVASTGGIIIKRMIDVLVSSIALIVLSPILVFIAIAIKLDSKGPIFFRQDRVGLRRKTFKMHKFRTMFVDAEERIKDLEDRNEVKGAAFKMTNDPRVTRVGRTLRKLSLDELPQFFDVLRGHMSLVGPRPLPLRDVQRFDAAWQKRRFSVKPGLTCLWQVNGRHDIEFEQWMELDLQYVDNWSLSMDFDILLKTIPAVLRGNGAS